MKGSRGFDLSCEILIAVSEGELQVGIDDQPYLLAYRPNFVTKTDVFSDWVRGAPAQDAVAALEAAERAAIGSWTH